MKEKEEITAKEPISPMVLPTTKDATNTTQNGSEKKPESTLKQILKSQKKYFEKRKVKMPSIEITEDKKAYLKNVGKELTLNQKLNNKTALILTQRKVQKLTNITYEEAKVTFWKIMKNSLAPEAKYFQKNGNNILIIKDLLKYFIGDPTSKLDLRKSIFLFGPMGAGKDFLMKCFKILLDMLPDYDSFEMDSTIDIYESVKNRTRTVPYYSTKHRCIKDLGFEPKLAYTTGEIPIMENILFQRHDIDFTTYSFIRTHVTSNYRPDGLEELYNQRIQDRAEQLWNFVFLNGPSLRKKKTQ